MKNKNLKKFTISCITGLTLFTALSPAFSGLVSANELKQEQKVTAPKPTGKEILADDVKLSEIFLIDGVAYDSKGNIIVDNYGDSFKRGKLSWAVKAIRKIYNKLPANVKKLINQYAGLEAILGLVDHFTGTVEDALYWACKQVGMPDWAAWTVTKAITLFI